MSVRVLVSVYQKAAFILYINPFERSDNFLPRRNENHLLVPREWHLVDLETERSSDNCWWKRYWLLMDWTSV